VGTCILHQRFGRGAVDVIDTSGGDAKIDVTFNDGQTRKLLLKFAKFEIL
jgi:DNA helicase-2/ATP-dependent DNA helicase PcrA